MNTLTDIKTEEDQDKKNLSVLDGCNPACLLNFIPNEVTLLILKEFTPFNAWHYQQYLKNLMPF